MSIHLHLNCGINLNASYYKMHIRWKHVNYGSKKVTSIWYASTTGTLEGNWRLFQLVDNTYVVPDLQSGDGKNRLTKYPSQMGVPPMRQDTPGTPTQPPTVRLYPTPISFPHPHTNHLYNVFSSDHYTRTIVIRCTVKYTITYTS